MPVTASISGNLQLTDNLAGDTTFLKQLVLGYAATVSSFAQSLNIGTSPATITLPNGSSQFVYIKNLSTVAGNTISVTWTPKNGFSAAVLTLSPGAAIIFSETDSNNGITALSLTASAVNTPVEYVLAS